MKKQLNFRKSQIVLMAGVFMIASGIPKTKAQTSGGTVTDIDGNVYHTITIGFQVWMVENLKTTRFSDGSPIPLATDKTWGEWKSTSAAYCWYNDDAATYKNTYGALYNWYAVNTGKLAPKGWHVPSRFDWVILEDTLGDEAGGKIKESGKIHWNKPNTGASNSSGFTALPGGYREYLGFRSIMNLAQFWSSTSINETEAYAVKLTFDSPYIRGQMGTGGDHMLLGFSVRCVKDNETGTFTDPRDRKPYKTVKIGTQTWMAENLAYKASSGCFAYDNNENNVGTYGYLYDWRTAISICPPGSHLPSDAEWLTLIDYLGGEFSDPNIAIKEVGNAHWKGYENLSDNSSGFTALPGGSYEKGTFLGINTLSCWWSSTEGSAAGAWGRTSLINSSKILRGHFLKSSSFSVRCLKD
jgi:uncharacterized protein (TIGR02145 family)